MQELTKERPYLSFLTEKAVQVRLGSPMLHLARASSHSACTHKPSLNRPSQPHSPQVVDDLYLGAKEALAGPDPLEFRRQIKEGEGHRGCVGW